MVVIETIPARGGSSHGERTIVPTSCTRSARFSARDRWQGCLTRSCWSASGRSERRRARRACAAEAAFEALVDRHGPMVLGVCRRALTDPGEIEDAFQATFLVLVRRARFGPGGDSLGRWLYGVARRVAAKARVRSRRDRARFAPLAGEPTAPECAGRPDRAAGGPRRGGEPAAREIPDAGDSLPSRGPDPRRGRGPAALAGRHGQRAALTGARTAEGPPGPPRAGPRPPVRWSLCLSRVKPGPRSPQAWPRRRSGPRHPCPGRRDPGRGSPRRRSFP